MRTAAALLAVLPAVAAADAAPPYPPATCAALWEGYADLFGDDGERALAARFRAASVARVGEAETAAAVARERPAMVRLIAAYVLERDGQSRDLFERLATGCGGLEAGGPGGAP